MKKLLKSEICGSINSVRMYCSQWNSQLLRAKKKKKGKRNVLNAESKRLHSTDTASKTNVRQTC